MTKINFDQLLNDLRLGERTVRFTKSDGTVRNLRCTLQESRLPPSTGTGQARVPNPDVVSVWDVEKAGWRSFRKDSVIAVEE
jgi:hypothetical protein